MTAETEGTCKKEKSRRPKETYWEEKTQGKEKGGA
jgi:hypothetical protein